MTQHLARTGMERVKKDLLHVAFNILVPIHAPASLCSADMNPVGCAITGAGEAFRIDKGFEQQGADTIGVQPIVGELMSNEREDFTGEVRDLNPGKDKKPAVVDEAWKIALASLVIPTDPAVSRCNFQSSTGEEQAGDNPV